MIYISKDQVQLDIGRLHLSGNSYPRCATLYCRAIL